MHLRLSLFFIAITMFCSSSAWAMGGRWLRGNTQTEAGYCPECGRSGVKPINLDYASGSGGSLNDAIKRFKDSANKHGKECLQKPIIMITDLSRGTANNMSYILMRKANGDYEKIDSFQTGQGQGVGNTPNSNHSPTGLLRLKGVGMYDGRRENGQWYTWPIFKDNNGRKFNYLVTTGLEPQNRNASARGVAFHPITYSTGSTTKGCTGIPMSKFQIWSDSLKDSCVYNYSPAH